jgi:eukaryotic-like serine/threonine-protein kinase
MAARDGEHGGVRPLDPRLPDVIFVTPSAGHPRREERPRTPGVVAQPTFEAPADLARLPAPGSIIDKYRLDELIGTGGFAVVYRATHLVLRTSVALKLLRPDVVRKRPDLTVRLCEEAMFSARIQHPNVVRILDAASAGALTYIVMELIEGEPLDRRIRARGPLDGPTCVRVALDVVDALEAGVQLGIIHRDVKPANILLTRTGSAKVVDFGLAVAPQGPSESSGASSTRAVVGTRGYMAPEQRAAPDQVDFRADVYALGATMFKCLTLDLPSEPLDASRILPPLDAVLLRMLASDRSSRHGSYDELRSELRDALRSL